MGELGLEYPLKGTPEPGKETIRRLSISGARFSISEDDKPWTSELFESLFMFWNSNYLTI